MVPPILTSFFHVAKVNFVHSARSNMSVVVAEYRALQHTLQKVTFSDLEKKYNIPEATIQGYYHKDPEGVKSYK